MKNVRHKITLVDDNTTNLQMGRNMLKVEDEFARVVRERGD